MGKQKIEWNLEYIYVYLYMKTNNNIILYFWATQSAHDSSILEIENNVP